MKRLSAFAAACAALAPLAALAPAPALAQDYGRPSYGVGRGDQEQARDDVRAGRRAPLARVIAQIAARYPGRHLNTTTGDAGGRPVYYVQWQMSDGRVVIFIVDAESGQVMGRQGG